MTSHVAPRAISSCLALRGDGNAALAGSFRARAAWASPFHRRAVSRAPSLRRARSVALAAGESAPSGARAESVSSSDSWREDAARRAAGLGAAAAAAEAETLAAEIAKHDALYYLDADPEISDAAYDRLRVRLEALEEAHPGARRRDSPTGRVGAVVNVVDGASALESSSAADAKAHARFSALARAAHVAPMRSLSNVFTDEEARAWERKLRRALGGEWRDEVSEKAAFSSSAETAPAGDASFDRDETAIAFVAEPKIDGASVSVTYVGGVLKKCVSRGDGLVGEDVTNQLAGCVGVPKTLLVSEKSNPGKTCSRDDIASDDASDDRRDDDKSKKTKIPGYLEVRGEVFIADADFARVNERRLERGLVPFKSARNAVAGAMRRLDPPAGDGTDAGPLRFAAYAWGAVFEDAIDSPTGDSRNENENENETARFFSPSREDGPRDPDDAATTFWRSQREFKAFAARLGFDPVPTLAAGDGVRAVLRAHETLAREREAALLCREAAAREEEGDGGDGRAEGVLEEQKQKQKMSFGYAVDGVVYKVDDVSLQRRLGADARAPRWATAHKFQAATAVTTLAAIEVQVGRTGALTPVAVLHPPAELGGASVRRATLHNFHDLERKKLHRAVGRRVLVERAGDVIPRVVGVADFGEEDDEDDTTRRQDARAPYRPPTTCPSCGSAARASPLIETGDAPGTSAAVLRCVGGLRCPAQATERIAHFVSRDALDVSGLAKTQIAAMLAEGIVTSPADLFTLRARFDRALSDAAADNETRDAAAPEAIPARWLYASGARAGTLKRSATKLFDALDDVKARGVPLRRFLFALGIRGVGRETAAALAKTFGTLEAFREAASSEAERERIEGNDGNDATTTCRLTSIDGVGPAVAATVGEFFAEPANVAALDATLANGVRVLPDDDDDASKASRDETRNVDAAAFEGLRVVVTGAVPGMTRAEALAAVARAGGVAQKAVSGKTDVLVAGDGAGRRKAEAAAERGARVIDARTFLETLFPDASDARER